MTDDITPALTPAEWERVRSGDGYSPEGLLSRFADGVDPLTAIGEPRRDATGCYLAALALANDLLPDGHKNKLTRADADELYKGHMLLEYPHRWERANPNERVAVSMALADIMLKVRAIVRPPETP